MSETWEAAMASDQQRLHSENCDNGAIAGVPIGYWSEKYDFYEGFNFGRDAWS
jgi:hypothetical protein